MTPGASGRERRAVHRARMTAQGGQTLARRRERTLTRHHQLEREDDGPRTLVLGIELLERMVPRMLYGLVQQRRHLLDLAGQLFEATALGGRHVGRRLD